MSDLLKSALSYIGSSSATSTASIPAHSSEVIKLGGESVKLLKVIAEGGSSYIYGGQFVQNNLIIAVKKIPCQHDNEDKILSEIKFMNGFNHVNIAKYYGYNKISGQYWIGLEYCSSLRLPIPSEIVGPVFGQIVAGVEYLHNLGITHWDLKVENCMVGRDQMIKLIDFGSASTQTYVTSQMTTMQRNQLEDELFQLTTPMYRPPEILDLWSEMEIDYHVDIWALGCVLYYLVHSEHPFSDSNKLAIINCKYARKSSSFESIIEGLLVINPPDRMSLQSVLENLKYLGINIASTIPLPFEEFQVGPSIIPNNPSTSLLHSIRGGAENLFKNLKESGSRIYSTQSQQQPNQTPQHPSPPAPQHQPPPHPPPPKEHPAPKRPPPPVVTPVAPRKQLTGEDVVSKSSEGGGGGTAFDLLSGFDDQLAEKKPSASSSSKTHVLPQESVDLLGGFKIEPENYISTSSIPEPKGSAPKSDNLLDDLFGLNQVTTTPAADLKPEIKKDIFDSLFSEQFQPAEKPLLPTSSSFNHLSSLKVDNKNDLVKSTPNLNDLFGDLLMDPSSSSSSGQRSSSSFGNKGSVPFGPTSVNKPAQSSMKPTFGVGAPPYNTSNQFGGSKPSSNISSGSNNFVGSGSVFPPFQANSSTINYSSDRPSSYQSHNDNPMKSSAPGMSAAAASTLDSKTQAVPGTNKKIDLNAAFGELLNEQGFSGASSTASATRTINDMRRTELMQTKSPEQLKVNDWVEGKRKNLRALLSTLHTVVWEGCSWKTASMSIMVEPSDVKKVYRKACLAIHPDKQREKPWEELAKLIFMELNEAWNHFENDNF